MWVHIPKESCPSSLESEDLTLPSNSPSPKPQLWLTLSGKPTVRESSWVGCKTRPWMKELFGMILPPLMASRGAELWIASLEASLAKTFPQQGKKQESKKEIDQVCSTSTSGLLTRYDQDTCSWRTLQACWITGQWALFSENWPKGGSMRNGECFLRPKWEVPIKEKEFLSWDTPNTMDTLPLRSPEALKKQSEGSRKGRTRPSNLREQVDEESCKIYSGRWPTPRASEIEETPEQHKLRMEKRVSLGKGYISPNLTVTVKKWPTPVRSDFQDRKESEHWEGSSDLPSVVNKFHTGHQARVIQNHGEESLKFIQNLPPRWSTPTTLDVVTNRDLENQKKIRNRLGNAELSREMMNRKENWATPTKPAPHESQDSIGRWRPERKNYGREIQTQATELTGNLAKRRLNPFFVEWLMGKPIGWSLPTPLEQSVYKHWETESALLLERLHSGFSLKD